MTTYSIYEAKAKFSEVIRLVRRGRTITVTHRGRPVAEIRPVDAEPATLEQRFVRFREEGILQGGEAGGGTFVRIARRPGALERFLAERDE
jgi:prevent-host-death family protein